MARITVPLPQVGLNQVQGARLSPVDNGGEALARGVAQVGAVAGKIAEEQDQIQLAEKARKTREELNGLMEFVSTVKDPRDPSSWGGKEGQSLATWFQEQARALVTGGGQGLSAAAAARYDDSMLGLAEQMRHQVTGHEAQLFEKIHDDNYVAGTEASRQSAALTVIGPDGKFAPLAATLNREDITRQVRDYAKRKQFSPEQTQVELVKQLSPMHAATMQALIDNKDSASAKAYYEENRAELSVPVMREFAAKIRVGNDYEIGDQLYRKYVADLTAENYADRLKQLNAEPELKDRPEVRGHVDQLLRGVVAAQEAARQATVKKAEDKAWTVYNSKGVYAALNSPEMAAYRAADESSAGRLINHFRAEARSLENKQTTEDVVDSTFRMAKLLNSEGFLFKTEDELRRDMIGMTKQHQVQLIGAWTQYKANAKEWQADKNLVLTALHDAKLIENPEKLRSDKGGKDKKGLLEAERFNNVMTGLSMLSRERGRAGGMTPDQQKTALNDIVKQVVLKKGVFQDSVIGVYDILAKFNDRTYAPVQAQMVQAAAKAGTGLNLMRMADIYGRAMVEGALITKGQQQGYIDPAWLAKQPEFAPRGPVKYAPPKDTRRPFKQSDLNFSVPDANDAMRKAIGGY